VNLVNAEYRWIAKRSKVVVLLTPIPDDHVIKLESHFFKASRQVRVERIELGFLPDIHNDDAAVAAFFQSQMYFLENALKRRNEVPVAFDSSEVALVVAVVSYFFVIGRPLFGQDIPVRGGRNYKVY